MSVLMAMSMFFMRALVWPLAMISKPCTMGTPAAIITDIIRLKVAISRVLMRLPAEPNSGFALVLTDIGLIPCRRSSARTRLAFFAWYSPLILVPRLSVPTQRNDSSWLTCARARPICAVAFLLAVAVAVAMD